MKDWNNSTVCPNDFCPEGNLSLSLSLVIGILTKLATYTQPRPESITKHSAVVDQNASIWIWKCPDASSPRQWWCGYGAKTFVDYTSGHFLGTAFNRSTSLQSATDIAPIDLASAKTTSPTTAQSQPHQQSGLPSATGVAAPNQASTDSAASAQGSRRSSSPSTAIGVGIGVPLGIAATGFLGFLFAREARLKKDKTKAVSPTSMGEGRASVVVGGPMPELVDEQRPCEVSGNGVSELVGTAAQIVPRL